MSDWYDVYRGGALLASVDAGVTSYSDMGVGPEANHEYAVRARDAAGNASAQSRVVSVTTPSPDVSAPGPPGDLLATIPSAGEVALTWLSSRDCSAPRRCLHRPRTATS